ncbi:hypothetical protein ACOTI9_14910 [Achromobacter mucicolens]|uniref:hypothetical protein n=1 Tax=Achromobacter mucicolens TaxID=1389922 RepID=UPI003B98F70B
MVKIHEASDEAVIYEVNGEWHCYNRSRGMRSGCYWFEAWNGETRIAVMDDFGALVVR